MENQHAANLLGALAVGVFDHIQDATVQASGLDPSAAAAVLAVAERSGQSIEELRTPLALTHSGAVRLVDRLERAGLLTRGTGRDGRSRGLGLSEAGRRMATVILRARREALQGLLSGVDLPDAFTRAVADLLGRLPATRQDAWRICRYCDHAVCRGDACPVGSAVL